MEPKHLVPNPARPLPKTRRGRDTREEILAAARIVVSKQWVHETPFIELSEAADVARASLLHAFPHWRDVLWSLLIEELDRLDLSYEKAASLKRAKPSEKAFLMLEVLLDRAEVTGRLYPNLRSAMFTWNGEPTVEEMESTADEPWSAEVLGQVMRIPLYDHYADVETLLGLPFKPTDVTVVYPRPIGECLVNFAMDLAAGYPSYHTAFAERRGALRKCVDQFAAGLRTPTRSKRTKLSSR